ncbi:MAG: response regulator [bacterium]|nr:response regulator [bacterium]
MNRRSGTSRNLRRFLPEISMQGAASLIRSRSFRRFLLAFLASSILPLVLLTVLVLGTVGEELTRQICAQRRLVAEATAAHLVGYLHRLSDRTRQLAADEDVRGIVREIDQERAAGPRRAHRELLAGKTAAIPGAIEMLVLDADGRVMASSDAAKHAAGRSRSPIRAGEVIRDPDSGMPAWIVSAPIADGAGEPAGMLVLRIDVNPLSRLTTGPTVGRAGSELGATGETYVVDRHQRLITESRFPGYPVWETIVDTPPVRRRSEAGGERAEDGRIEGVYEDYRGVAVIGASVYLPELQWTILAETDAAEALRPVREVENTILILAGLLLGCGVAGSLVLTRLHLRPLQRILHADLAFIDGDEAAALIPEQELPGDDFGRVMRTRNQVLAKLGEARATLHGRAAQLAQLNAASRRLLGAPDQAIDEQAFLHDGLESMCRLIGARCSLFSIADEEGGDVQFIEYGLTEQGPFRMADDSPEHGTPASLAGRPMDDPSGIIVIDDLPGPVPGSSRPQRPELKSLLGVRVATRRKTYGRIYLWDREAGGQFTGEDASLARELAQTMAFALETSRLEAQARSSERRYLELFNSAPTGILQLDAGGGLMLANQTLLDWLGLRRDEVLGTKLEQLITEARRPVFRETWERCGNGQAVKDVDVDLRRNDQVALPVSLSVNGVFDARGEFSGVRATVRDLSRERGLQAQLQQAQKMEAVGLLAGGVAHDFNNLLMVIGGNVELAQGKLDDGELPGDELATIDEAVRSASVVVRHLLTFSSKQIFEPRLVEVSSTLSSFTKMLTRLLREDIELRVRAAPNLGTVYIDRAALEQAVMNLTLNARDAMPYGGVLTIEVQNIHPDRASCRRHSSLEPGDYVRITVADTGVGMDRSTVERVFDPFFTTKTEGTGLGLSVVYGIVQQHNGFVEVSSRPGRGARFDIYLPLAQRPPASGEAQADAADLQRGEGTILVAEDEERLRRLTSTFLGTLGYSVLAAGDGEEAVQLFTANRERINLVVLDSVMPRLSGATAYEKMRRMRPDLPCIFVTGYSEELSGRDRDLAAGVLVLHKPLSCQELGRKVTEVMGRERSVREQRLPPDDKPEAAAATA